MLGRIVGPKRRPDDWSTPHERALVRLSDRLDGPLDPDEAIWLADHLESCDDCRAASVAYAEEREMLRALPMPEPPRDLFARTMAVIEVEESRRSGRRRSGATARRLAPYGALGSLLVVALVVGATAFAPVTNVGVVVQETPSGAIASAPASGVQTPRPTGDPGPPSAAPSVPATPILVADVAPVTWARPASDGSYDVNLASVSEVCSPEAAPDCAPIDAVAESVVKIPATPASVVGSPDGAELVVADAGTRRSGGSIFALSLPEPTVSPAPSASPGPSASPAASPSPSPLATLLASIAPSPLASPDVVRTAILDGVILVGETAAYSPSGDWFAFTARPADGSRGSDVYVWRSGTPSAVALTDDHRSVFGSWLGEKVIVSSATAAEPSPSPEASPSPSPSPRPSPRPSATPVVSAEPTAPASAEPSPEPVGATVATRVVDPAGGDPIAIAGPDIWRPIVDPSGSWVIFWNGTVTVGPNGVDVRPLAGRLVVARFDATGEPVVGRPMTVVEGPVRDWDARWDEHGGRLALWVADADDDGVGALSAFAVDPSTGVDLAKPLLDDVLALPGMSIGRGRLAWATPPGQGGDGSRLQVLAWAGPDAGTVSSDPGAGDAPVIVVR